MSNLSASKPFIGMSIDLWGEDSPVTLVEEPRNSGRSADIWIGEFEGTEVAVKIYRPTFDDGGLFDESIDREYSVNCDDRRIVVALGRGVIKFRNDRWSHVLVMPLIDADSLRDVIKAGGLDSEVRIALCNEIVSTLISLHECGVIHGDLNPANILASGDEGEAYLVDLEFCLPVNVEFNEGSGYSRTRGTPGYIAPEIDVYGIKACSTSSDVWALGWVLAEILNKGGVPEVRNWTEHREEYGSKESMLRNWNSTFGEEIDESIKRCVIIDKRDRIKLDELEEALRKYV